MKQTRKKHSPAFKANQVDPDYRMALEQFLGILEA